MLAQFLDGGMIVIGDQLGQREVRRIEDAHLASEQLEQTRGLLDDEPRIGAFAQATVKQKDARRRVRSEAHTSELQSPMRISYAVFCLKKKNSTNTLIHVTKAFDSCSMV